VGSSRQWTARGLVAAIGLVLGCATHRAAPAPVVTVPAAPSNVVTASWYGPGFHGRRTASGERFDKNGMSAAHPTLPFGTPLCVTNVANGRSVRVRVTDRGPFRRGRSLDLSYGAARRLDIVHRGTARVRVAPAASCSATRDARR